MWNLLTGGGSVDVDEDREPEKEVALLAKTPPSSFRSLDSTRITSCGGGGGSGAPPPEKHRIPSPTRQRGDGMEASGKSASTAEKGESSAGSGGIVLPQTNIRVDKLPPIPSDKDVALPAVTPASPLMKMAMAMPPPPAASASASRKKTAPKFVPYEPYKAAVSSFVPRPQRPKAVRVHSKGKRRAYSCSSAKDAASTGAEASKENEEEEGREVAALREKLADAEKQLAIQVQVNAEVKKLLVASVGEDIEAKVDYLTQDKARLASDIRGYSNTISRDFEVKEKLSVESDLWKSKFLACSVVVDELARWKASLTQRCDDIEHRVRLLLHERSVLWDTLSAGLDVLNHLRRAFDPLSAIGAGGTEAPPACSVLGLADQSLSASRSLSERLLGPDGVGGGSGGRRSEQFVAAVRRQKIDTPAEEGLREVVSAELKSPLGFEDYSAQASVAITGAARPHLAKMSDKLASPSESSQFKCCAKCNGGVQVV